MAGKRGRPMKDNTKSKAIRIRLTEDEFLLIGIVAEECDTTKSALLMESFWSLIRHFTEDDISKLNEKFFREKSRKKTIDI